MTRRLPLSLVAALLALSSLTGCDEKDPHPGDGEDSETAASDSETDGVTEGGGEGETVASEDEEGPAEPGAPGSDPSEWPAEAVPCAGELEARSCQIDGKPGVTQCVVWEGKDTWTACVAEDTYPCTPGFSEDYGCLGYYCAFDGERLFSFDWQTDPECATPLVLSFDAAPVRFDASASAPRFDFAAANGSTCATDWPSAPWLALDRDRDGSIDSGRELFGSGTRLASGRHALHGFEALAELDADGDGRITPADPRFAELVLWADHDADRTGDLAELLPAGAGGLVAIHLNYERRSECDERGNCGRERAAFEYRDAAGQPRVGEIVDVYLACQ